MSAFDSATITFTPPDSGGSPAPKPVGYEHKLAANASFAFKQVFLTKGADGKPKELVFALEVKDPAEANMAAQAREAFLKKLADRGKVVSYFDIRNMTMTCAGSSQLEAIAEDDEDIKILRGVYERVERAREQAVFWPSFPAGGRGDLNGPQSFARVSSRIHTMNAWTASTMIEKLNITSENEKKRVKAILDLREKMITESTGFGDLPLRFFGTSLLALVARAAGVGKRQLKAAIKAEPGEQKEGFIEGKILGRTNDEITSDERDYLTDIELLGEEDRLKFIQASHERKRPVTQDSLDHALLAAFETAVRGDVDQAVEDFCAHPLVAKSKLTPAQLTDLKTKLKDALTTAATTVHAAPHPLPSAGLDPLDPAPLPHRPLHPPST